MKLKVMLCVVIALCAFGDAAIASVVGQITGRITDAETRQPVVGASVAVKGTAMGDVADDDGVYTILNVPVGTYTLVITAVGYATVEIENVQVSADLASYHDMEMQQQAADIGEVIRVTAVAPLVTKDKTTTVNVIKRDELLALPTRGFEQVVGIQNSVVRMNSGNFGQRQRGQRDAKANSQELNLRGGRPSEVAYYVDGFSQQDPLTGLSTANINNNAIKEISVVSGAFSAEYGHVASGIVNVITNSGTPTYHGNAEILTDQVLADNWDNNYYSADFSGPIPGTERGFFFVSGERRFLRDRSPSTKTEEMFNTFGKHYGLDTLYEENPKRLPGNSLSGWSWQGKVDYDLSPNVKLSLSGNGSIDNWREYRQEWLLNPDHGPRYEDKNMGLNAKISHMLNKNTFYNLSASYFTTERIRGDNQVFDDYAAYERFYVWPNGAVDTIPNPEYDDYNLFWTPAPFPLIQERDTLWYNNYQDTIIDGTDTTYLNPLDTITTVADTVSVDREAYYVAYLHQKSSYIGFKGDMTSQLNQFHTIKTGFDFQYHTLRYFRHLDATKGYNPDGNELLNRYGFDVNDNEDDPSGDFNNTKQPYNLGLFIQDRMDWRGLVVQAGLRFDYFNYNTKRLKNPADPFGAATPDVLDDADLEDAKNFYRFSPRLGVSFPVSPTTQMHINYGKFFQRPDLNNLYVGYDFLQDRVTAGSYFPFPSPNLEPEKTTQYEVGVTQALGDNVVFDIIAYYKDVEDLTQIQHQEAKPREYDFFGNVDYGTIKGFDVSMQMRRSRGIRLDLKYSLSYATGTGSYPQSTYSLYWFGGDPPKTTNPLDYDQRHNFTGILDWRTAKGQGPRLGEVFPLENTSLNVIAFAGSGSPFTPQLTYDEVTEAAVRPLPEGPINSASKPWTFSIDVKLERAFAFGNYRIIPYVWVKNLLDRDNIIGVYESTGEPGYSGYLDTPEAQDAVEQSKAEGEDYEERFLLKEYNPTNWSNPRQIMFGVRMSF